MLGFYFPQYFIYFIEQYWIFFCLSWTVRLNHQQVFEIVLQMIACFYFCCGFCSEVPFRIFNFSGQTCVPLHCRSLSKSLRHGFLFSPCFSCVRTRWSTAYGNYRPFHRTFRHHIREWSGLGKEENGRNSLFIFLKKLGNFSLCFLS